MAIEVDCPCGKRFKTFPSKVARGQGRYCSKPCKYQYRVMPKRSHGLASHPLYDTHLSMVARCHNPEHPGFPGYGARGITVYPDWRHDATAFVAWVDHHLGPRPDGMSLDRIDNERGYEPGNVRWADASTQHSNIRSHADSTSPYLGVSRDRSGKWRAQIRRRGEYRHLGYFGTPELARDAYQAAALQMKRDD